MEDLNELPSVEEGRLQLERSLHANPEDMTIAEMQLAARSSMQSPAPQELMQQPPSGLRQFSVAQIEQDTGGDIRQLGTRFLEAFFQENPNPNVAQKAKHKDPAKWQRYFAKQNLQLSDERAQLLVENLNNMMILRWQMANKPPSRIAPKNIETYKVLGPLAVGKMLDTMYRRNQMLASQRDRFEDMPALEQPSEDERKVSREVPQQGSLRLRGGAGDVPREIEEAYQQLEVINGYATEINRVYQRQPIPNYTEVARNIRFLLYDAINEARTHPDWNSKWKDRFKKRLLEDERGSGLSEMMKRRFKTDKW